MRDASVAAVKRGFDEVEAARAQEYALLAVLLARAPDTDLLTRLAALAGDLVPERPGRREPRAVKRRPKPYPVLTKPRNQFVEIPHRSKYRKAA